MGRRGVQIMYRLLVRASTIGTGENALRIMRIGQYVLEILPAYLPILPPIDPNRASSPITVNTGLFVALPCRPLPRLHPFNKLSGRSIL